MSYVQSPWRNEKPSEGATHDSHPLRARPAAASPVPGQFAKIWTLSSGPDDTKGFRRTAGDRGLPPRLITPTG